MRTLLQKLLTKPIIRLADKYASRPDKKRVHEALSTLFNKICDTPGKRGLQLEYTTNSKVIIFSDQHKGARNYADDFALSEKAYLAALEFYNRENYLYCNLGDSEELWENTLNKVLACNQSGFEAEKLFLQRNAFIKIFGNHDLYWDNDPLAPFTLEKVYGQKLKIYEGLIFNVNFTSAPLQIFLTHGHQGDLQSDGNWFSKWFVSNVWAPLQAYLRINPNTPAYSNQLKSEHNAIMYAWTAERDNLALITGHTHQPVFNSLTHLERLYLQLESAQKNGDKVMVEQIQNKLKSGQFTGDVSPRLEYSRNTYFNTGCCCFSDGDITGIELEGHQIRLIKWKQNQQGADRIVLEECELEKLLQASALKQ